MSEDRFGAVTPFFPGIVKLATGYCLPWVMATPSTEILPASDLIDRYMLENEHPELGLIVGAIEGASRWDAVILLHYSPPWVVKENELYVYKHAALENMSRYPKEFGSLKGWWPSVGIIETPHKLIVGE